MLLDSWSKLDYLEKYWDKNDVCFDATFVGQSL